MAIDNDVYNRVGDGWWDADNPLVFLHGSMTRGRFEYFLQVLGELGRLPSGAVRPVAVDIGCGGGFLAEEFARVGYAVIGVDPSEVSVQTARRHAAESGLEIDYRTGTGEALPAADASVELAYCCDVLEHVTDVDRVLAETARVLRPGGVYCFDTLNRTWAAKVLTKMVQDWRLTRIIDFPLHDGQMFLPPADLTVRMARHGLRAQQLVGLGPRTTPWVALATFAQLRRGKITYRQASERLHIGRIRSKAVQYMGYALRE
jgi:2-polyprenyl-6-hydroxyphenyl methylase / 3-demethylubiquinone-9 3-methyltransferase